MKLTTTAILVVLLSLLATTSIASADMMTYDGKFLTERVRFHCPDMKVDGRTVPVGLYNVTYKNKSLKAFCVDAHQYAGTGDVTERGIDFLNNSSYVAYLYETYMDTATTSDQAAGLGVAIWEVLYEEQHNEFDASDGWFHISQNADVVAAANAMLLNMPDDYQSTMDLTVLYSPGKQDMLVAGLGSVPEPATLGLLFVGVPLLLKKSRRGRLSA